jgi:hypothetical protein
VNTFTQFIIKVPNLRETAIEETEHLFLESDKNVDGALSFDEIVDEYKLWVGSEATSFGDHLHDMKDEL